MSINRFSGRALGAIHRNAKRDLGLLAYNLGTVSAAKHTRVTSRQEALAELLDVGGVTVAPPAPVREPPLDRDAAITRLRAGLKARTGRAWSVKGGTGTSWGYLMVDAPPKRRTCAWDGVPDPALTGEGYSCEADRALLHSVFGERPHPQGHSISPDSGCRERAVQQAEGRPVTSVCSHDYD